MTAITLAQLSAVAGREPNDNMRSVLAGLSLHGGNAGLVRAHRITHYIAQLAHESGRFRYDREVWDGKGAQARYDTRTDLGNTPERDGDGYLFRGRTAIQVTGGDNYRGLTAWLWRLDPSAPDFSAKPDLLNQDPWEGIAPLWFWETRGLNSYADRNHIESITKRINGGLNGYADRVRLYVRTALVMLGYGPEDVPRFQGDKGLKVDGDAGPLTRDAMHRDLTGMAFAPAPTPPVPMPTVAASDADKLARIRAIVVEAA